MAHAPPHNGFKNLLRGLNSGFGLFGGREDNGTDVQLAAEDVQASPSNLNSNDSNDNIVETENISNQDPPPATAAATTAEENIVVETIEADEHDEMSGKKKAPPAASLPKRKPAEKPKPKVAAKPTAKPAPAKKRTPLVNTTNCDPSHDPPRKKKATPKKKRLMS